jgi:hypothetical protein
MTMADRIEEPSNRSQRILRDLAEALGCSVDAFRDRGQPTDSAMTQELLSLWLSVTDTGTRQRILDSLRAAKRAEGATSA